MIQPAIQLASGFALEPGILCRHLGIFGATGKGKTWTAARIVQGLRCPVIVLDAKGDLGGLGQWLTPWAGIQIDPNDSDILARALDLSDVQTGALEMILAAYPCRSFRGFRDTLATLQPQDLAHLGRVSPVTLGALQRASFSLTRRAPWALGPAWPDLARLSGRYIVPCADLVEVPGLYSAFVASVLTRLYRQLGEVGDAGAAGLCLMVDESHLVFSDAPPAIVQMIERVARLIRSKGVSLIWVSQSPGDLPDSIMGQIGTRIQHGLNGATMRQQAQARAAAETLPGAEFTARDIMQLGTGRAIVSDLAQSRLVSILPPQPWNLIFSDAPPLVSFSLTRPRSQDAGPIKVTRPRLSRAAVAALALVGLALVGLVF